jgi:hypothetical protein
MKLTNIRNIEVLKIDQSLLVKGGARDTRSTTTTTTTTVSAEPAPFEEMLTAPAVPPKKRR